MLLRDAVRNVHVRTGQDDKQVNEQRAESELAEHAALLGACENQANILAPARVDEVVLARALGARWGWRAQDQLLLERVDGFGLLRGQLLDNFAIQLGQNVLHTQTQWQMEAKRPRLKIASIQARAHESQLPKGNRDRFR